VYLTVNNAAAVAATTPTKSSINSRGVIRHGLPGFAARF
jgi:hypothetical protein